MKTEQMIKALEKQGFRVEKPKEIKLHKFPDLKLEVTPIQDWENKPYNEIVVPKGFRKIKVWELWRLLASKYRDKFMGSYKGKNNWFACEQEEYDKKNKKSRWLVLGRDLGLGSGWYWDDSLADSISGGRVVFVRSTKKILKEK